MQTIHAFYHLRTQYFTKSACISWAQSTCFDLNISPSPVSPVKGICTYFPKCGEIFFHIFYCGLRGETSYKYLLGFCYHLKTEIWNNILYIYGWMKTVHDVIKTKYSDCGNKYKQNTTCTMYQLFHDCKHFVFLYFAGSV